MSLADTEFVRLPGLDTRISIAARPRRAARHGLVLVGPSRRSTLAAVRAFDLAIATCGTAFFARRARGEALPVADDVWDPVLAAIERDHGPMIVAGTYRRIQASRSGGAVLLCDPAGRHRFVKLQQEPGTIEREHATLVALDAVGTRPNSRWRAPAALGHGTANGWSWLMTEGLSHPLHRPAYDFDFAAFGDDLDRALAPSLGAPPEPDWRVAHGDLAPWNVRRCGGSTVVLDWETVGWAPPRADEVYFAACAATLRSRTGVPDDALGGSTAAAVDWWLAKIAARDPTDTDAPFNQALTEALTTLRNPRLTSPNRSP